MSNNLIIFIIFIIASASVSPFEIEIIKNRANDNPFGFFGPPDNLISEIINDMEKNMEKSQSIFPMISNKNSKNKLPHRHKEIIEVNGPGFKSIEIREVLNPEDQNKIKELHGGTFGHFAPITSNTSSENILDKMMEEFQNDASNDKKSNPIENIFGNLFARPQHNPVIFFQKRKNLKQDNIFNSFKDQENKQLPGSFKIFPALDNIIDNIASSEITHVDHKDRPVNLVKEHMEPPQTNSTGKKEDVKSKENKNDKLPLRVVSNNKNTATHYYPHHQQQNFTHYNHQAHTQTHPSIPKISSSHNHVELHKNTEAATNIKRHLSYLPPFLIFKDSVMQYIIYVLIFLIAVLFVICLSYKIILRDNELNKGNTSHSINQIEDELKGMKEKNKLY